MQYRSSLLEHKAGQTQLLVQTTHSLLSDYYDRFKLGEFSEDSNVVMIFPDHGSRYMSKIYSDQWMEDQGFLNSNTVEETQQIQVIR